MGYVKWYLFLLAVQNFRVVTGKTQDGVLRLGGSGEPTTVGENGFGGATG